MHDPVDLLLALRPLLLDRSAFFVEVLLHRAESLDDCLHTLTKARSRKVLIYERRLRLLTFGRLARDRNFKKRLAQRDC